MALLLEETTDSAVEVSARVVEAYSLRRERVQQMRLADLVAGSVSADLSGVPAIVVADARIVELVVGNSADLEALAPATWILSGRGWDVVVLVPCNRIGDAHSSLRAAPCQLQPWWLDADGVWFGACEIP